MTATTPSPDPEWLALGAGRVCLHWLAAGTTLVALEGSMQLEPPSRWLPDMPPTLWQPLSAGHARVLETSGWWGLHANARSGVHLRIVAPPQGARRPAWSLVWRRLMTWIQPRQISRG
ncbi:hypothetical protein [Ralstonia soli]|uniref:Uncharacterized protein n=1 Tax=Ralstonia soli TaxID=2953896 RepID=A0ABT1AT12_9RALS|nr:hypothetical protein [Ralstonia soli]MCO5401563.1 hypothetical protein [Ralstonia soli]